MKKIVKLLPIIVISLVGCSNSNSSTSIESTIITLNLSNFNRYISSIRYEGYTGAVGFSPYEAWFEFRGLLTIGIYDVTVTYSVDNVLYNYKLDTSGSGKTEYFDRLVSSEVTNVSGTVSYLEPNTKIELDSSNFDMYISYTRQEGFTGVADFSPYEAWFEFKGSLTTGVYEITVTYTVNDNNYSLILDVSGGGKTSTFDRSASSCVTAIYGFVKCNV